ncbi:MAG TPA: O-methyltransferase [Candidatus Eisenbacteria bacterium]|jgi:predicted O-methyltransferase YrrM|nr:O-methyltransferase [Candidatus Eisenbacteria bacterium]
MNETIWADVDRYIGDTVVPQDEVLTEAIRASEAAGLPSIAVSASQGKLLHIIARAMGTRSALEIGTLGGYSTIWIARALLGGGHMITLEADPKHAEVARANIARAGFAEIVDVRLGKALDTLPKLKAENQGPFDLVFIDADKVNIPQYYEWSLKLTRPGSLIVVDNVVRDGGLINPNGDESVQGVRKLHEILTNDKRVSATTIQTVGSKGWDGVTFALVAAETR